MDRTFITRALLLAIVAPASAVAQTVTDRAEPAAEVVVTGTRGQARSIVDSPTPIDVIGTADLEKTGKPGVLSALNTLVPSFNMPTRAGGGTSAIIATGGLRGLNPDQTLILVNGKRRHKSALINAVSSFYNGSVPADLDLIPGASIERIEVLRDGAAAQYGSDAIAGVINIITRSRPGGEASFTAGQNFDRSDGEIYSAQIGWGTALGDRGHFNFFFNAKRQQQSNRAIPIDPAINLYPTINGMRDPREATIDRLVTRNNGAFPVRGFNLGYDFSYDLDGVELYSFGTYGERDSDLIFTFRAPTNAASLPQVYPDGFRPELEIFERDHEFALGIRGDIGGWHYDLSTTYGGNRARQNGRNTINASLGPSSPTAFYVGTLRSREWVNSFDLTRGFGVGTGKLQVSAGLQHRYERYQVIEGEPLSYANGGYTYVVAGKTVRPPPGGQAAAGFQPGDAGDINRTNLAAYLDLAWDPTANTTVGGALRYENYNDASGNTLIGKANVRQAVTPWLALRGAVSSGFRAPALAQQIYASTTGQFRTVNGQLTLLQIKTLPVGSPSAIALGAEPLTPETSTNISLGMVLTPARGLSLTVDTYRIKVKDRIAITSTLTGPAVSAILVANNLPPDISAQYYTNAIDTRTSGVDVIATYRHGLGALGKMSWNIGYNYNKTIITRVKDNPPELQSLGSGFVLFDRRSRSNLTENLPRTKLYISNIATIGRATLNTRVVRFGAFKALDNPVVVNGVQTFPNDAIYRAKWITDVELAYDLTDTVQIAVGANNLFNVYPDFDAVNFNRNTGSGFYPSTSAYGFTGGSYYGRVRLTF